MPARKRVSCCTDGSRSPLTTVAEVDEAMSSSSLSRDVVVSRGDLLLDEDRSMTDGSGAILAVRTASAAAMLLDGCLIEILLGRRDGSEASLAPIDCVSELS
jgi:hypothetical protein